jgi:DNA-binding response OmpR family regulator
MMHLLLVEDHADSCTALTSLLTRWGYDVVSAGSVKDALAFLDTFRFDILLSDIGLPDGDGLEVVSAARTRRYVPTAVALTAHGSAEDRDAGLRAGFEHYLTKPLDVRELRRVLPTS